MEPTETVLVQVLSGGRWTSYSRCTREEARTFLRQNDGTRYRAVDWMDTEHILDLED